MARIPSPSAEALAAFAKEKGYELGHGMEGSWLLWTPRVNRPVVPPFGQTNLGSLLQPLGGFTYHVSAPYPLSPFEARTPTERQRRERLYLQRQEELRQRYESAPTEALRWLNDAVATTTAAVETALGRLGEPLSALDQIVRGWVVETEWAILEVGPETFIEGRIGRIRARFNPGVTYPDHILKQGELEVSFLRGQPRDALLNHWARLLWRNVARSGHAVEVALQYFDEASEELSTPTLIAAAQRAGVEHHVRLTERLFREGRAADDERVVYEVLRSALLVELSGAPPERGLPPLEDVVPVLLTPSPTGDWTDHELLLAIVKGGNELRRLVEERVKPFVTRHPEGRSVWGDVRRVFLEAWTRLGFAETAFPYPDGRALMKAVSESAARAEGRRAHKGGAG